MPARMSQKEFEERVKEYTKDTLIILEPYVNRRTPVKVQCKKCQEIWKFSPSRLMPNSIAKYSYGGCPRCSQIQNYTTLVCEECGKEFQRLKSQVNENHNFCSRECGNRWKNKQVVNNQDSTAYRRNAFLHYPHQCGICGWNKDERILEVHHIDENRQNNDIHNLIILCPNCHKFLTLHLFSLEELQEFEK